MFPLASTSNGGPVRVQVCLLGSFRLLKVGSPVSLKAGGKTEQLLGQLALGLPEGVAREALMGSLWPDVDGSLAGQSLNTLVHSLRRLLGDALGGRPPIVLSAGRYALNVAAGVNVDIADFDTATRAGDRMVLVGDLAGAADLYRKAIGLYAGDLAIGSDIGALLERERLRSCYLRVLAHLADDAFAGGDYQQAMQRGLELVAHDPCREDAHRLVMRCLVRLGFRSQALRQYQTCQSILKLEFDAVPEPATQSLYDQVRMAPALV
jgi:DNA-binding SARP family transcriptional activator